MARPCARVHRRGGTREVLAGDQVTYYCGFDPTAASLHLGTWCSCC